MPDRYYDTDLLGPGNRGVTLHAVDEGPIIPANEIRSGKVLMPDAKEATDIHGQAVERSIYTGVTGQARVDPYKVKPQKTDEWAKVISISLPSSSDLVILARPLLRHRAVNKDGQVFLFQQGKGQIARIGLLDEEEEWICIEKHFITAYLNGPNIKMVNDYVLILPGELPNEASPESTIEVVHLGHVRQKPYAVGKIAAIGSGAQSDLVHLDEEVVYATELMTEVVVRDYLLHVVHSRQIWGVIQ